MLGGVPYMQGIRNKAHALFLEGRMVMILTPNDIHCGWNSIRRRLAGENVGYGATAAEKMKNGYDAVKMGINIVTYSMTR